MHFHYRHYIADKNIHVQLLPRVVQVFDMVLKLMYFLVPKSVLLCKQQKSTIEKRGQSLIYAILWPNKGYIHGAMSKF